MRLKLPLALLCALLCCYVAPVSAARTINYFNPSTSPSAGASSLTPNTDGSWASSGVGKNTGSLSPAGATSGLKWGDIKSISFTSTQHADKNFYANMYLNLNGAGGTGGLNKYALEVAHTGYDKDSEQFEGVKTTWSTNGGDGQLKFIPTGGGAEQWTLDQLKENQQNWSLSSLSFSVGDSQNTNPGVVDIYNITLELADGTIHTWSFIAPGSVVEVSDTQSYAANGWTSFSQKMSIKTGSSTSGSPLLMTDKDGTFTIFGGQNMGNDVSLGLVTSSAAVLKIADAKINGLTTDLTQGKALLYLVEGDISEHTFSGEIKDNTVQVFNSLHTGGFQQGVFMSVLHSDPYAKLAMKNTTITGNTVKVIAKTDSSPNNRDIYSYQGGIYIGSGTKATIDQLTYSDNTVEYAKISEIQGGQLMGNALCVWGSDVTISNSHFNGNISNVSDVTGGSVDGGVIAIYSQDPWGGLDPSTTSIKDTEFIGNKSTSLASYVYGGVVRISSTATATANLILEDVDFDGNIASGATKDGVDPVRGAALYSKGSLVSLKITKDASYTGNQAIGDGVAGDQWGGFLYLNTTGTADVAVQAKATFDIAAGKSLTIGDGSAGYDSIAGNVGSLIVKDNAGKLIVNSSMEFYLGALEINAGTFATTSAVLGASSVKVASGVTFIAGVTGTNLVTSLASKTLSAEKGATLGTYLTNTGDLVTLKHSDIMNSIQSAYAQADVSYTYWTQGKFNIDFSTDDSGSIGGLGEGSTVTVTGSTDELTSGSINLAGGTADLTQVTGDQPISGSVVTGDTGTMVTKDSQTVLFDANQNVGYSLNGGDADTAGAKLVVGSDTQSNATAPEVVLRGDINAKAMELNVGTTSISGSVSTTKGIIVGNSNVNTNATLTNNGTIHGKVDVLAGNTLKGAGTYTGDVSLAQSTFVVGNSPGQSIFATGSSLDASDTNFLFAVDGTKAAVQGGSTSGTYSNIILRDTVSATGSGNTATIEVWKGLFDATSTQLNLTLINNEGTGSIAADFFKEGALVTGQYADLLKNAKISMDADGNVVLTGSLDTSYAQSVIAVDAQAYANSLWSSSQVLSDFGKLSRDQASAPRQKALNLWMSAMGDFSSVTGAQGYTYNGGGYGIGGDYAINKSWIAGAGFGQTWGTNKTDNAMLSNKQDGTMFSLYGQYAHSLKNKNTFFMDGYFGYAQVENKATAADGSSPAKWSDNAYAAGLRASWALEAGKDFIVTPFVALDFVTAAQGAIHAGTRTYNDGKMHNLTMPIGLNFAKKFSLGGSQYLIPSLSVAYAPDLSRKDPSVRSSVLGEEVKFTGVKPGRNAAIINVGTRWIITPAWSTSLNYSLEARPKMTNQAVNISCNYSF